MKSIGILGGMGPEATAELYLRIIRIFQVRYGAKYDSDFPEIIIINVPIPDVVEDVTQEQKVKEMLLESVRKLQTAGVDIIAVPCNTAMFFFENIDVPIVDIVQETLKVAQVFECVGVIGTKTTLQKKLYGDAITPNEEEQKLVTQIILRILAGEKLEEDLDFLTELVEDLKLRGAERVILGCTELPLLIESKDCLDTLQILAEAVVRETRRD